MLPFSCIIVICLDKNEILGMKTIQISWFTKTPFHTPKFFLSFTNNKYILTVFFGGGKHIALNLHIWKLAFKRDQRTYEENYLINYANLNLIMAVNNYKKKPNSSLSKMLRKVNEFYQWKLHLQKNNIRLNNKFTK